MLMKEDSRFMNQNNNYCFYTEGTTTGELEERMPKKKVKMELRGRS